jgi:hypothetical protein
MRRSSLAEPPSRTATIGRVKLREYPYSQRDRVLLRRALTQADSSAALMARARAIEQLIDESVPVPVEKVREASAGDWFCDAARLVRVPRTSFPGTRF